MLHTFLEDRRSVLAAQIGLSPQARHLFMRTAKAVEKAGRIQPSLHVLGMVGPRLTPPVLATPTQQRFYLRFLQHGGASRA